MIQLEAGFIFKLVRLGSNFRSGSSQARDILSGGADGDNNFLRHGSSCAFFVTSLFITSNIFINMSVDMFFDIDVRTPS